MKKGNISNKKRLIIISNRLPVNIEKTDDGKINVKKSVGGLATGLGSFYKSYNSVWIGWPGIAEEELENGQKNELNKKLEEESCYPVFIDEETMKKHYNGFCNKTIWPLFHYFLTYSEYNREFWHAYKKVNELFMVTLRNILRPDDVVCVHDYHLLLLPEMIRKEFPDISIGFFLHIPFPSYELFRTLTLRKELLRGMIGADLIGFHTYGYAQHFLDSVKGVLRYGNNNGEIIVSDRPVKVDVFPMGVDFENLAKFSKKEEVEKEVEKVRKRVGDRKIIISVDRMDYTKGIPERLEAFELFLEKNPEWREKVTLIMIATPSRELIDSYQNLRRRVDELVGRINGLYGKIDWTPIHYIHYYVPFEELIALFKTADVAMVTPLRDGMNLVAKEFLSTKTDEKGVLLLSEMAGAAEELSESVIVNPNNIEKFSEKIKTALELEEKVITRKNHAMIRRISRYNVKKWASDFLSRLEEVRKIKDERYKKIITPEIAETIKESYNKAGERLFFLDYDGTLIKFFEFPHHAKPDEDVLNLLKNLSEPAENEVVIISGRKKSNLDKWFGDIGINMIAEHGVYIKEKGNEWKKNENIDNSWKEKIRDILLDFEDRTPGSFVEEKDFSMAWHYRNVNPDLSQIRVNELKSTIINLVKDLNLSILEGSKVIEIKNVNINKGLAVKKFLNKKDYEFVLIIGDDATDEDMFANAPQNAYTVKVGLEPSYASFNVKLVDDVRDFLKNFTGKGNEKG